MACPYDIDNDIFSDAGSDRSQKTCAGNPVAVGRGHFSRGIFKYEDSPVYVRNVGYVRESDRDYEHWQVCLEQHFIGKPRTEHTAEHAFSAVWNHD